MDGADAARVSSPPFEPGSEPMAPGDENVLTMNTTSLDSSVGAGDGPVSPLSVLKEESSSVEENAQEQQETPVEPGRLLYSLEEAAAEARSEEAKGEANRPLSEVSTFTPPDSTDSPEIAARVEGTPASSGATSEQRLLMMLLQKADAMMAKLEVIDEMSRRLDSIERNVAKILTMTSGSGSAGAGAGDSSDYGPGRSSPQLSRSNSESDRRPMSDSVVGVAGEIKEEKLSKRLSDIIMRNGTSSPPQQQQIKKAPSMRPSSRSFGSFQLPSQLNITPGTASSVDLSSAASSTTSNGSAMSSPVQNPGSQAGPPPGQVEHLSQNMKKFSLPAHVLALNLGKAEEMRLSVMYELLETEEDYVRDLTTIVRVHLKLFKERKFATEKEITSIFSNVDQILPVAQMLLKGIKQRIEQNPLVEEIGDVFIKMADLLKIYSEYCANYPNANSLVASFKQKDEMKQYLKDTMTMKECKGLTLESFLIKPVQRICKYPLLLREMLRHTPNTSKDHPNIEQALEKVEKVVEIINERTRMAEETEKVLAIQNKIDVGGQPIRLLSPSRRFIREGTLQSLGPVGSQRDKTKDRLLVIFSDLIVFCKPAHGVMSKGKYTLEHSVEPDKISMQTPPVEENDTKVRCILEVFVSLELAGGIQSWSCAYVFGSEGERQIWAGCLETVVKKYAEDLEKRPAARLPPALQSAASSIMEEDAASTNSDGSSKDDRPSSPYTNRENRMSMSMSRAGSMQAVSGKKKDSTWGKLLFKEKQSKKSADMAFATAFEEIDSSMLNPSDLPNNCEVLGVTERQHFARNENEVSFVEGAHIRIVNRDRPDWWKVEMKGLVGLVSSEHIGLNKIEGANATIALENCKTARSRLVTRFDPTKQPKKSDSLQPEDEEAAKHNRRLSSSSVVSVAMSISGNHEDELQRISTNMSSMASLQVAGSSSEDIRRGSVSSTVGDPASSGPSGDVAPSQNPDVTVVNGQPWRKVSTPQGQVYFVNLTTRETSWKLPSTEALNGSGAVSPGAAGAVARGGKVAFRLPSYPDWIRVEADNDAGGRTVYYYNEVTKKTAWTLPGVLSTASTDRLDGQGTPVAPGGAADAATNAEAPKTNLASSRQNSMPNLLATGEPRPRFIDGKRTKSSTSLLEDEITLSEPVSVGSLNNIAE